MFNYFNLDQLWNITFDSFGDQSFKLLKNIFFQCLFGMIGINQMMFDLGMNVSDFNKTVFTKDNRT